MNASKVPQYQVDSLLTSYQVGSLLQVNPSSVNKWVKDGRIPAFRTPGGHRRIRATDLVAFLTTHKMPIPSTLASASRRRLLIVENDAHQLGALERAAKAYGDRLDVVCVSNGVDAMVQVGAFAPHLILLDAQMPNFDTYEVCRRLKGGTATGSIGVVIASQEAQADAERRGVEAGAQACLPKPVQMATLLRALGLAEHVATP